MGGSAFLARPNLANLIVSSESSRKKLNFLVPPSGTWFVFLVRWKGETLIGLKPRTPRPWDHRRRPLGPVPIVDFLLEPGRNPGDAGRYWMPSTHESRRIVNSFANRPAVETIT